MVKNVTEAKFMALAEQAGWRVSKRGWPDFVCFGPDDEIIAVEVKPRTSKGRLKRLSKQQIEVMDWLSSNSIDCYVSDGETLESYN